MAAEQRREIAQGALRVSIAECGTERTISLRGELDLANASALETEMEAAMAAGGEVVIDLRELEFIDSTGIALLIDAMHRAGDSAGLSFIPSKFAAVTRVLELTGVAERMRIVDGDPDGLQAA